MGAELTPGVLERLEKSKRPDLREALADFLIGLRLADPDIDVKVGYAGWNAIDVSRRGRHIARILVGSAKIQIDNLIPGTHDGDYGPELVLGQKGVWTYQLKSADISDQVMRCLGDTLANMAGRRIGAPSSTTPDAKTLTAQSETWRRSKLSKSMRFAVLVRDEYTCQYCGRRAPDVVLQVDHRVPVAKGGSDEISNLATACVDCNLGKGARHST
jgi:hypothetical protein